MSHAPQTPARAPRVSGIPTPGARSVSGIPTPGRPRSVAGGHAADLSVQTDHDAMRALSDAIRANDPASHRHDSALAPDPSTSSTYAAGRRSVAGRASLASSMARPNSGASFTSSTTPYPPPPVPPVPLRSKTPVATPAGSSYRTPRQSTTSRPASRQSDVFGRTPSRLGSTSSATSAPRAFDLGDRVKIESLGIEGTLQFLGETQFKAGLWAGVELTGVFAGKGKNDGTVNGVHYFDCAPECGVFVAPTKLSHSSTAQYARPSSVASSHGRATPSGRSTPSFGGGTSQRFGTGSLFGKTPTAADASRGGKYAGLNTTREGPRPGSVSPTRGSARAVTSIHTTPKAGRPSASGLPGPRGRPSLGPSVTPKATIGRMRSPIPDLPFLRSPPNSFAKPITPTFSQTSSDTFVDDLSQDGQSEDSRLLEMNGKALADKISRLINGSHASSPSEEIPTSPLLGLPSPIQPTSNFLGDSIRPNNDKDIMARVEMLERELQRKYAASPSPAPIIPPLPTQPEVNEHDAAALAAAEARATSLEEEKTAALLRIAQLEEAQAGHGKASEEAAARFDALEKERSELAAKLADALSAVSTTESTLKELRADVETKVAVITEHDTTITVRNASIAALEGQLAATKAELAEERLELGTQVEELRQAGQETIALYEERLSSSEANRYELEDLVKSLEEEVKKQAQPISPSDLALRATTAARIDNESLQEQIIHLQKKVSTLEEQLDDSRAAQERDEQAVMARIARFRETEAQLRNDIVLVRREQENLAAAELGSRTRVAEVTEALRESDLALEDARAEIETLRVEVSTLEAVQSAHASGESPNDEVAKLKTLLQESRTTAQKHADTLLASHSDLEKQLQDARTSKAELERIHQEANQERLIELQKILDERTAELEAMRAGITSSPGRDSVASKHSHSSGRDENLRDQVKGLKHVVQELTKENAGLASANKLLDSDNKMLISELEEMREHIASLEKMVEDGMRSQDAPLNGEAEEHGMGSPLIQDVATLKQSLKDAKTRYELELEQNRKKMSEIEKKNTRTVHDLNKEIAELENLVEAKIYREDDLEREVERLKEKLSRKSSKASGESMLASNRNGGRDSLFSGNGSARSSAVYEAPEHNACEVCGEKGHDLLTCPLVFDGSGDKTETAKSSKIEEAESSWCEDCESRSHATADCPHSQDVF